MPMFKSLKVIKLIQDYSIKYNFLLEYQTNMYNKWENICKYILIIKNYSFYMTEREVKCQILQFKFNSMNLELKD